MKDFASALRSSLREDPDVILVGEMRGLRDDLSGSDSGRDRTSGYVDSSHYRGCSDYRQDHRCLSRRKSEPDTDTACWSAGRSCDPVSDPDTERDGENRRDGSADRHRRGAESDPGK